MRINETFAEERNSEIKEYRKKYFIASEGTSTEPKYFENLNLSIIKENVTIINILRDYANKGSSNPSYIIKLLNTFLENSADEITVYELKNKIKNWNHENSNKLDIKEIYSELDKKFESDDYRIKRELLADLFMDLFKSEIYSDLAKHFAIYFQAQDVTYSPERDTLNMVVDRDEKSFTENQYDEVIKFCQENNVNLYISNPNFELWLLMHFDEFDEENPDDLFENRLMNNSGRRYLEKRLHDICKYKKNKVKFSALEPGINKAIKRAEKFAINNNELKNKLGTNVGKLVEKIISEK